MATRKKNETVQYGLRIKESLRSRLEKAAKENDVSLNAEMATRLERSLSADDQLNGVLGSGTRAAFLRVLAATLELVERQTGGQVFIDPLATASAKAAIERVTETFWIAEAVAKGTEKRDPPFPNGLDGVLTIVSLAFGVDLTKAQQLLVRASENDVFCSLEDARKKMGQSELEFAWLLYQVQPFVVSLWVDGRTLLSARTLDILKRAKELQMQGNDSTQIFDTIKMEFGNPTGKMLAGRSQRISGGNAA
jgi:hypothetical protein